MIVLEVKIAKTFLEKVVGLLAAREAYALLFKTRFGLHTIGMRYPIDVVILDKENRVVAMKDNIKPFSMYFWNPMHDTLIELPSGFIKQKKIQVGDSVIFRVSEANREV